MLRGWAVVLEVHPYVDDEDPHVLPLRAIGPDGEPYRKHFLDLEISRVMDRQYGEGDDHPEGLCQLDDMDGRTRLLIVYDSPAAHRIDGEASSVSSLHIARRARRGTDR